MSMSVGGNYGPLWSPLSATGLYGEGYAKDNYSPRDLVFDTDLFWSEFCRVFIEFRGVSTRTFWLEAIGNRILFMGDLNLLKDVQLGVEIIREICATRFDQKKSFNIAVMEFSGHCAIQEVLDDRRLTFFTGCRLISQKTFDGYIRPCISQFLAGLGARSSCENKIREINEDSAILQIESLEFEVEWIFDENSVIKA